MENLPPAPRAPALVQQSDLRQVIQLRIVAGVEPDEPAEAILLAGSDRRGLHDADRLEDLAAEHIPYIRSRSASALQKCIDGDAQQVKVLVAVAHDGAGFPGIRAERPCHLSDLVVVGGRGIPGVIVARELAILDVVRARVLCAGTTEPGAHNDWIAELDGD